MRFVVLRSRAGNGLAKEMRVKDFEMYSNVGLRAPELRGGGPWLNSDPLALRDLRGRVVLVDFWTYTCLNCLHTLPYVKAWQAIYAPFGLVVIGVHTPEFDFEREASNVATAVRREGVRYPVVLDNERRIWRAFTNRYWPTRYLIDGKGVIRHHYVGEGGYRQTETALQELLREVTPGLTLPPLAPAGPDEEQGGFCLPATPEVYCGYYRGLLANPEGYVRDRSHAYQAPAVAEEGLPSLQGTWTATAEYLRYGGSAPDGEGYLALRYRGLEANLVACPREGATSRIDVRRDGRPLGREVAGRDVAYDEAGRTYVEITSARLYNLVREDHGAPHLLELGPRGEGVELYSLTFGACRAER
ncbi:MAG: thioredoxin family protein [Chloroflexota bacterium]